MSCFDFLSFAYFTASKISLLKIEVIDGCASLPRSDLTDGVISNTSNIFDFLVSTNEQTSGPQPAFKALEINSFKK